MPPLVHVVAPRLRCGVGVSLHLVVRIRFRQYFAKRNAGSMRE